MKDFVFVSGNQYKVEMLQKFLGTKLTHHAVDLAEIQSLHAEEIVEHKAKEAYKILKKPVLVDDVSLSITALGGLPGAFVKFFLKAIDCEGICKLADMNEDRSAVATTVFGYYDGKNYHEVIGKVNGSISDKPRGDRSSLVGMGWNSIFIPEGQMFAIAEMSDKDLQQYTPRGRAVVKLKKFLEAK